MLDELDVDNFVLEGFKLPLEEIHTRYPNLQYFVFGFPNASVEEKIATCRKYDRDNWTNVMTDEELSKFMKFLIDESKHLEEVCQKRSIPFFDTSKEYWYQIKKALEMTK